MRFVCKPRQGVIGLRLQVAACDASAAHGFEGWKSPALKERIDEGGDEDRLSGARQACHTEPDGRSDESGREVSKAARCKACTIRNDGEAGDGCVPLL